MKRILLQSKNVKEKLALGQSLKVLSLSILFFLGLSFHTNAQCLTATSNGVYDLQITSGGTITVNAVGAEGGRRTFTDNRGGSGGGMSST